MGDTMPQLTPAAIGSQGRLALWRGRTALVVAALALVGFAVTLLLVTLGDARAFDLRVTLGWQRVAFPGLLGLMEGVSWFGFQRQSTLLPLAILAFLLIRRLFLECGFALVAALCTFLYSPIKELVQRQRPVAGDEGLIVQFAVGGYSFPSGHVMLFVIFGGFIAYLTYTLVRQRPLRIALLTVLLGLIILVGPSRVYLGQHWATDTLASYFLGTTILVLLILGYRAAKARQLAAGQ
jgi:undecaprenyl-diphosphatase